MESSTWAPDGVGITVPVAAATEKGRWYVARISQRHHFGSGEDGRDKVRLSQEMEREMREGLRTRPGRSEAWRAVRGGDDAVWKPVGVLASCLCNGSGDDDDDDDDANAEIGAVPAGEPVLMPLSSLAPAFRRCA